MAKRTNLIPKKLNVVFGDAHIYSNHLETLNEMINRIPYPFPKLIVNDSVKDKPWEDITLDDFELVDYKYHPKLTFKMAV
jgi:thymidylate synthase